MAQGLDPGQRRRQQLALSTLAGDARAKLKGAFDEMKTAARSFFDEVHNGKLKAITDAKDLADALADKPVNEFPGEHRRRAEQAPRGRARQALAEAANPTDQAGAQQNLTDFLTDQQLEGMANKRTRRRRSATRSRPTRRRPRTRYTDQIAGFKRSCPPCRRKHPGQPPRGVARSNATSSGSLGPTTASTGHISAWRDHRASFVTGLKSSVKDAEDAAAALSKAGTPKTTPPTPDRTVARPSKERAPRHVVPPTRRRRPRDGRAEPPGDRVRASDAGALGALLPM